MPPPWRANLASPLRRRPPINRAGNGADAKLPRPLITALFGLKAGESTLAEGARGTYVARLKEVRPANPSADKDAIEAMRQQLTRAMRSDLMVQYAGALRERYTVDHGQARRRSALLAVLIA